jgi:hypothetical protein
VFVALDHHIGVDHPISHPAFEAALIMAAAHDMSNTLIGC